jgi:DNA-binding NarL/FixJ family response regulator
MIQHGTGPSELRFAAYLDTMPEGVMIVDTDGAVCRANPAARVALELPGGVGPVRLHLPEVSAPGAALHAALVDLTLARRTGYRRFRLMVGDGVIIHAAARLTRAGRVALLVRREVTRESELRAILGQLGLDPISARLATRVYRGWSNRAMADAWGVPVGTIKWRLHRLFRRLGLRRRADLVRLVNPRLGPTAPATGPGTMPADASHGGPAAISELRAFLEEADVGFAALDEEGRPYWANRVARRLVFDGAPRGDLADLMDTVRIVARGGGEVRRSLRLHVGRHRLRVLLWHDGPRCAGLRVQCEQLRAEEMAAILEDHYALSPLQARVAVSIARGHTTAEIAGALGLQRGTVMSVTGSLYERLNVHSRVELTSFLADLRPDERALDG